MVQVVVKLLGHESKRDRDPLIHFAVRTGRLDVVQLVLSAGGNPFETDRKGRTALALALEMGLREIAECLVAVQDRQRDTLSTILPNAWSFQDFKVDGRRLTDQEVNQLLLHHTPLPYDTYLARPWTSSPIRVCWPASSGRTTGARCAVWSASASTP